MMKETAPAPKYQGIIAVAALFGVIAAGVAIVLYDFGLIGGVFVGVIVGVIAAIVLALGWREPAAASKGVTETASATVSAPTPAAKEAPAPKPAAAAAPKTAEPKIKPSAALAGEAELDAKKGEWKYKADAPAAAKTDKPEFLKAAREGGPDDLKQIKGVGPKLEKTLHGMGIFHFDQIATWGPSEQAWIDDNLEGFKGRATRDSWVDQAKTLAAGGTTEFSGKVKKGGVY